MRAAQGLGRALLARFVDDAVRMGAEQVFLEVRVSQRRRASRLYEREGFVPSRAAHGYYPRGGADGRARTRS